MNPSFKPGLTLIPIALLGLIAVTGRPKVKQKPTPQQIARYQQMKDEDESKMLEAYYKRVKAENKKWQKIMWGRAKKFVIVDGRKVPSSTDDDDRWFKAGQKDGQAGIAETRKR